MDRNDGSSRISAVKVIAIAVAVVLVAAAAWFFISRNHESGAAGQVSTELDALKSSNSLGSEVVNLRDSLSEDGREAFDEFLEEVRDFDYEITGTDSVDKDDSSYTTVKVRIRTCDFGREYLAAWTGYLKDHGDSVKQDDDPAEFYELLFARLAALDEKTYIKDIDIICIDPIDNGQWIANIKDNKDLQDAIFGGMISEMETLAADD